MSMMLCLCIFCVALLMYLFVLFVPCLTVFVNCLVKQLAMCLVWWINRVCYSTECACCASDPSMHLSVPFIWFVCVFVCRKLSPHLGV